MILTQLFETTLRDKEDLQAKRKTLQDLSMNKDVDQKVVQQRKLDLEKEAKRKGLAENAERLNVGDPVEITGNVEFNGATGEIAGFGQDNRFVIVNLYNHGRHSFHSSDVSYNDYADAQDEEDDWYDDQEDTMEGWSDAIVARRTGRPRTPYSVYIKGKKWKDFENDDHAEAVANKLRAKFKADGRDSGVITIAPTDYDQGVAEGDISQLEKAVADAPVKPIANMEEAKSLAKRVRVVKTGETGTIRQIKPGAHKGAPKTYYVDLDNGGQADNLPASALRLLKDQTVAEANPHNFDSDVDFYAAKNAPAKRRSAPSDYPYSQQDDDAYFNDIFRKKRLAKQQAERDADHDRIATGTNETRRSRPLKEDSSPVENAILHRIMVAHSDILAKYGPQAVMDAANDTADFVGDVDEIGSSDVSAWVKQTIQILDSNRQVDEVSKATLGRYVKLAGADVADRASSSSYKSGAAGDKYNKADPSRQEANRERGIDRAITRLTK